MDDPSLNHVSNNKDLFLIIILLLFQRKEVVDKRQLPCQEGVLTC